MEIEGLFNPVRSELLEGKAFEQHDALRSQALIYTDQSEFPSGAEADLVIMGVDEYRGAGQDKAFGGAADAVRSRLYALKKHSQDNRVVDIGNLVLGNTLEDTYFALGSVVTELVQKGMLPLIIGGSQDLTFGQYKAFENLEQVINITGIDARFDLGGPDEPMSSTTYLGRIVLKQPNYLFNFSNIGHQTYYVGQEQVQLMEKLFFDSYRLGQVQEDMREAEPIIRGADLVTVDMSAIRQSDAPAAFHPSPNGFFGNEACQVMHYAGMSDKLQSLGLYELDPGREDNGQTAGLAAQMIWYFIEGFSNRKQDLPASRIEKSFTVYRVPVSGNKQQITFLKSKKTERWWMELPTGKIRNELIRHHFLPCSYRDYEQACNDEIPDRWWLALQKMA